MGSLTIHLSFLLLLTTLLSCMTPINSHTQKTTNDLVRSTCKQTPDPTTCEAALRSDPRSSTVADTEELILIMVDVVKSRFSESLRWAQETARKTRDPGMTRALNECIRVYRVVVEDNVVVAVNAVKTGDPKFGEEAMVDSGNEANACRFGFPSGKEPGQLSGRTRILHGVSNVAASLIKTLE